MKTILSKLLLLSLAFVLIQCESEEQTLQKIVSFFETNQGIFEQNNLKLEKAAVMPENTVQLSIRMSAVDEESMNDTKEIMDQIIPPLFTQVIREDRLFNNFRKINGNLKIIFLAGNKKMNEYLITPEMYNGDLKIEGIDLNASSDHNYKVILKTAVDVLNKNTPIVDEESGVTIEAFGMEDLSLVCNYHLHEDLWTADTKEMFEELIFQSTVETVKMDRSLLNLVEKGISIKYVYRNKDKTDSISGMITQADM